MEYRSRHWAFPCWERAAWARRSAERRRVGERTGELDFEAAVRVLGESAGVGQLTEPAAVGTHGENLPAVGVGVQRIAARLEDYCPCHLVLNAPTRRESAVRRKGDEPTTGLNGGDPRVEVGDLAQPATVDVDGEPLAASVGVPPDRVGGGPEERARPVGVQEAGPRVHAAEVRELDEILAVLHEEFGDRGVNSADWFTGFPRTLRLSKSVGSCVTPKVGTTRLPTAATCGGRARCLSPLPSIRTVKAAPSCCEFEPSGSTNVKNRTVSLSINRGYAVTKFPTLGGEPEGRRVTCVRWPVARSSTTSWTASSPPGPGP